MKIIMLLAGRGRRMSEHHPHRHKSLTPICNKPLLELILENFSQLNLNLQLIPVLGYQAIELESVFKKFPQLETTFAYNNRFNETNNLYSLVQAETFISGDPFVIFNGDLLCHKELVRIAINHQGDGGIVVDDSKSKIIDSPKIKAQNGRILDLGRHLPTESSAGYAVGIYKIGAAASLEFFVKAHEHLNLRGEQAGFHDHLENLFSIFDFRVISTQQKPWQDLDEPEDIAKIERIACTI